MSVTETFFSKEIQLSNFVFVELTNKKLNIFLKLHLHENVKILYLMNIIHSVCHSLHVNLLKVFNILRAKCLISKLTKLEGSLLPHFFFL